MWKVGKMAKKSRKIYIVARVSEKVIDRCQVFFSACSNEVLYFDPERNRFFKVVKP